MKQKIRDALITLSTLLLVFGLVLVLQRFFAVDRLIPMLFVLGVFIVSLHTSGYFWGIAASLLGVLAVNYAFMFPYYAIDLLTPVNMATAVVMLAVSIMTSTLTTQISIQQQEKAAAERERMRANLLRAISHDLRTPLTSISGACSVILDNHDTLSVEKQLTLLSDMRRDADWLIRMVENLLSVTRIDEKKMLVSKTPTVLEELIDTVLVKFYKHYPDQQVEVNIPDEFVSIPMDAMLIEQVLINLLENAVVHAKGMNRLCLTVTMDDGKACFAVSDDGCGIPAHKLNDLFTGYLDRDQTVSDGQRTGMGIGLFVCAAIVRTHSSEIQACNLPGGGASFRFALDMEEEDEQ
ncbi:MAG: PAS domain-containing sensor histidine kinase [Clostridia bacterium]|nr:PAS domain-containing sensor histidine kinase [Clostridia bacterium]